MGEVDAIVVSEGVLPVVDMNNAEKPSPILGDGVTRPVFESCVTMISIIDSFSSSTIGWMLNFEGIERIAKESVASVTGG